LDEDVDVFVVEVGVDRLRRERSIEVVFNLKYLFDEVFDFNDGKFNVV
jgi:hypothetical protein